MASLKNEQWSSLGSRVANARPRGLSDLLTRIKLFDQDEATWSTRAVYHTFPTDYPSLLSVLLA